MLTYCTKAWSTVLPMVSYITYVRCQDILLNAISTLLYYFKKQPSQLRTMSISFAI